MKTEATSDTRTHQENMTQRINELIQHAREDIEKVNEPRFQALLETTAKVLTGLRTAFQHYGEKEERAWGGQTPESQ